ncbi:MAG: hypothetical protein IJO52_09625 [Clostridia bacterium]|nr:hypothetical protein [Clostridia bacterium]
MKKINYLPQLICAVLFIVTIFLFAVPTFADRADELYKSIVNPIKKSENIADAYLDAHESFTEEAEVDSFTENLWNRLFFIDVYSIAQRLTLSVVNEDVSETILKDNHGLLHFSEERIDVQKYADKVIALNEAVNVPLIYVQAPNKNLEGYTELPKYFNNHSNQNADDFLAAIDGKVEYLDLRDVLEEEGLEKSELFYVTDHHWTTETAFWGYRKTVEALREKFGIDIDEENFYSDINNYTVQNFKNVFLGAQGRRVGRFYAGMDDYSLVLPKFETSFVTNDTITSPDKPVTEGDFRAAFIDEEKLMSQDDTYSSYLGMDRGELIITNKLNPDGKRLLVVKDSFARPYTCFMATGVSEIAVVDMRYLPVRTKLADYINEYNPDAVIFLYNTEVFNDSMFRF